MPIIYVKGLYSPAQRAGKSIQTRTVFAPAKRGADDHIWIDGFLLIGKAYDLPEGVDLTKAQWEGRYARKNGIVDSRLYEQILLDRITGLVIGERVFIVPDEPALMDFMKHAKRH